MSSDKTSISIHFRRSSRDISDKTSIFIHFRRSSLPLLLSLGIFASRFIVFDNDFDDRRAIKRRFLSLFDVRRFTLFHLYLRR